MNAITLPAWLQRTTTMRMSNLDVTLAFALVLRNHGTADAVRKAARKMRDLCCMEHRPRMKTLANMASDDQVMRVATAIVQDVTDFLGIHKGRLFEPKFTEAPRCHYKHMMLAGEPGARHWVCQHCSHTKPIDWRKP